MSRREQHAADTPAGILDHHLVDRRAIGLALEGDRVTAEALRCGKEQIAQDRQTFTRVIVTPATPVAVGPLVVAGGIDQRPINAVHVVALTQVNRLVARPAALDITHVDGDVRRFGANHPKQLLIGRNIDLAVRHIAERDNRDGVRRVRVARRGFLVR